MQLVLQIKLFVPLVHLSHPESPDLVSLTFRPQIKYLKQAARMTREGQVVAGPFFIGSSTVVLDF